VAGGPGGVPSLLGGRRVADGNGGPLKALCLSGEPFVGENRDAGPGGTARRAAPGLPAALAPGCNGVQWKRVRDRRSPSARAKGTRITLSISPRAESKYYQNKKIFNIENK
jgi:hypothetical protein